MDAGPDVDAPLGETVVFEVSIEEYSPEPRLEGVFLTASGRVYRYDYFADTSGPMPAVISFPATEQDLRSRWGSAYRHVKTISVATLTEKAELIEPAARGVLLSHSDCPDDIRVSYLGYLYDAASDRYTRVVVAVDGERAVMNTAPEAAVLREFLDEFGEQSYCGLYRVDCVGATCAEPPHDCPAGEIPTVYDGCWNSCAEVDRCFEVADCSLCREHGLACATGTTGSYHCVPMLCESAELCGCPFLTPCAGGSVYCTVTGPERVRCGG